MNCGSSCIAVNVRMSNRNCKVDPNFFVMFDTKDLYLTAPSTCPQDDTVSLNFSKCLCQAFLYAFNGLENFVTNTLCWENFSCTIKTWRFYSAIQILAHLTFSEFALVGTVCKKPLKLQCACVQIRVRLFARIFETGWPDERKCKNAYRVSFSCAFLNLPEIVFKVLTIEICNRKLNFSPSLAQNCLRCNEILWVGCLKL